MFKIRSNDIFFFLIRLTIGIVFIQSGWGKIQNIQNVIAYFTDLKIPLPIYTAYTTAWTELVAGVFIIIGFLTRISSLSIFIIMVVAIITTQIANLENWSDLLGTIEFLYALMCLGLILIGAEEFSIDCLIKRKSNNKFTQII